MRDVLELRQIKLELAAYMGEELPEPEIQQSAQEEQSFEGEREDFKDETSLPTTPALEGSPMLEQMGEVTPLASSINSSISKEERKFESSEKGSAVSTSRSSSSSLGPGIQIDLHSLIAPITIATSVDTAGTGHTEGGDNNDEQDDCLSSAIDSATSISSSSSLPTSTSFDYSSPPSSIPGSEDNSLSCSPVTSDSEFGSGSGTLSSCEEYDDLLLRRGSGDTSCDDDEEEDEEDQNDALIGIQGNNTLGQAFNGEHSSRTPTRVSSLLRPGQYTSPSSAKSRKRTSSTSSLSTTTSKKEMSKIEVGCIQIALPVLDENHGFPVFNTNRFDFSNPATHHEAWKPPTF